MTIFEVSDGTNSIYDRTDTYSNKLKNISDYWKHLDGSRNMGVKGGYYGIRGYSSLRKARADNGTNPDKLVIFMLSKPITVLQLSKGIDDSE